MSYFLVEDFRLGQDSRKSTLTALPGTLTTLVNGHITRGGEIEKRKSFVSTYTIPSGTFGLIAASGTLYTFGSGVDPGVPAGITYQRLQHPSALAMTALLSADLFDGDIYAIAEYSDGSVYHFFDGTRITDLVDGKARGSFNVTAGTSNPGVNRVTSVKVNGIEALNTAVDWTTSHSNTASLIATQINSYASTPEYTATADGVTVIVSANAAGTASNGYVISVTVGGDVTVSTPTTLSGGLDAAITGGRTAVTFGSKVYATSSSQLLFSAVDNPTDFNDSSGVGSGAIDMANYSSGSAELTALEPFYGQLAVFAEDAIQLWNMVADPDDNTQTQILRNTGTFASKSVVSVGDGDVFYLARNGVRALKSMDSSSLGTVSDVGIAIDDDVIEHLATLTTAQREAAVAIVEPTDKRYWLAVGTKVFVYSYFPGSKISAWSTYTPGFTISDFAVLAGRVYARASNTVYLYGGAANTTYDTSELTFVIPYLDAKSPGNPKQLLGIDMVAEGDWFVQMASNPGAPEDYDDIGTFSDSTFDNLNNAAYGRSTYFGFKFTQDDAEYARFSRFAMHFKKDAAKNTGS